MKEFEYVIKDELGIHARPAGLLVKCAQKFKSDIAVFCGEKTADAKRLFNIMGLNVKQGDSVKVSVTGEDEDAATESVMKFFEEHL